MDVLCSTPEEAEVQHYSSSGFPMAPAQQEEQRRAGKLKGGLGGKLQQSSTEQSEVTSENMHTQVGQVQIEELTVMQEQGLIPWSDSEVTKTDQKKSILGEVENQVVFWATSTPGRGMQKAAGQLQGHQDQEVSD